MLDILLASLLLLGLPVEATVRAYSKTQPLADKRKRYRKSMAIIALLLTILFVDWTLTSRRLTQLGLAAPTSRPAIVGCLVAVLAAIILFFAPLTKLNSQNTVKPADPADAILPQSRDELRSFAIFVLVAGFGWEVLYRGFLLFWLSPMIGLVPAVAASSTAYGLSHGSRDKKRMVGSLVSALLFTTGYAATGSLWWLILLHMALPMTTVLALSRMESRAGRDQ